MSGDDSASENDEYVDRETTVSVSNEFATVEVSKIQTPRGERLEISSVGLGYRVRLDALQLESLSWQDETTFSELLEEPFGPEK